MDRPDDQLQNKIVKQYDSIVNQLNSYSKDIENRLPSDRLKNLLEQGIKDINEGYGGHNYDNYAKIVKSQLEDIRGKVKEFELELDKYIMELAHVCDKCL